MSSILRKDKIGNLTHSAGNILLASSILTIGGRQYETTSTLSVALPAMTANTRYQVYAVQTAGVVSLVISQNENSVGPAGYSSWKLVGSLMANGASPVAFGSFINIVGAPRSQTIFGGVVDISATTTPPTKASLANRVVDSIRYEMMGGSARINIDYEQNAAGTAGSGDYLWGLPENISMDVSVLNLSTTVEGWASALTSMYIVGNARFNIASPQGDGAVVPYSATRVRVCGQDTSSNGGVLGSAGYQLSVAVTHSLDFMVPIQGWSNIPIEDR